MRSFPKDEAPRTIAAIHASSPTAQEVSTLFDASFEDEIKRAILIDPEISPFLEKILQPDLPRSVEEIPYLERFKFDNDTLLEDGLIYIPNDDSLKLRILRAHHDSLLAGHPGQEKTYELVSRNYTWPRVRQFINSYIKSCNAWA